MKLSIGVLFYFLFASNSQDLIFAEFNDECILWSDPSTGTGSNIGLAQKGDSCIVLGFIKPVIGAQWVKVITPDTIGYVMASFLKFPEGAVYELMNEKDSRQRAETAMEYVQKNKSKWIEERDQRQAAKIKHENETLRAELAIKSKKLAAIKFELSKYTLLVRSYSFAPGEYSSYPDFDVTVLNCNPKKTIKYIWFTVTVFNAVDDPEGTKTVKGIGPIIPFEDGVYNFENVIISKVVSYGKINSVKIQYMDGSFTTLTGKQLVQNLKSAQKALEKLSSEYNDQY